MIASRPYYFFSPFFKGLCAPPSNAVVVVVVVILESCATFEAARSFYFSIGNSTENWFFHRFSRAYGDHL